MRRFARWWETCDRDAIDEVLDAVRAATDAPGGGLRRVRARRASTVRLRRSGAARRTGRDVHAVGVAVVAACRRTGLDRDDHDATVLLARAAEDAAAALGARRTLTAADAAVLLAPFTAARALAA